MVMAREADIETVIQAGVTEPLLAVGFKNRSRHYTRDAGLLVHCASVQAGKWNRKNDRKFTVELGLWIPGFNPLIGHDEAGPPKVTAYSGAIRIRLGCIAGLGDRWWRVRAAGPIGRCVAHLQRRSPAHQIADLQRLLNDHALPWFGRMTTIGDIIQWLHEADPDRNPFLHTEFSRQWRLAALHHLVGDDKSARSCLQRAQAMTDADVPVLGQLDAAIP